MRATTLLVVAALAALLTVSGADAARKKTKTVKTTGTVLGHNTAPPAEDGSFVFSGVADDAKLGDGAVVSTGKDTGEAITGRFTLYVGKGSVSGPVSFAVKPSAQAGFVDITGTVEITGGTGAYKRAKGKGTVTGTSELSSGYYDLDYAVSFKHKR